MKRAEQVRAFYEQLIAPLRAVAREHGYALAVHGSLARDIDLLAVAWVPRPSAPEVLAAAIRAEAERVADPSVVFEWEGFFPEHYAELLKLGETPTRKPHGRLAWSFWFHPKAITYIDLSVIPSLKKGRKRYANVPTVQRVRRRRRRRP